MRNITDIINKIILIINEKSSLEDKKKSQIINELEKVKKDCCYRAPELAYIDWNNLAMILNAYFIPSNSKWETEIMIIFNDLQGSIEDYWQGDEND